MIKGNVLPVNSNNNNTAPKSRLKKLRENKNLTQQQVADKIGVTVKTYRSWEKDIELASSCYLIKLADTLHVSVDYLLNHSDFTSPENDYIGHMIGLSDDAISELLRDDPDMNIILEFLLARDNKNKLLYYYIDSIFHAHPSITRLYTEYNTDLTNPDEYVSKYDIRDAGAAYEYRIDKEGIEIMRSLLFNKSVFNHFAKKGDLSHLESAQELLEVFSEKDSGYDEGYRLECKEELENVNNSIQYLQTHDVDYFSEYEEIEW